MGVDCDRTGGFGRDGCSQFLAWRNDHNGPWSSGLIIMSGDEATDNVADAAAIPAHLRLLSSSDVAEMLLFGTGDLGAGKALGVKGQVRVKLIELPLSKTGLGAAELQSGRLPEPGRNEVISGADAESSDTLNVGGQELKVVGVLKPGMALFANSYLIPPDPSTDRLFPAAVPTVHRAWLVDVSAEKLRDPGVRTPLERVFPAEKFVWLTAPSHLEPERFYLYLTGLAVFLLGGSAASIALFGWLAGKLTAPVSFRAAPGNEGPASLVMERASPLLRARDRRFATELRGARGSGCSPCQTPRGTRVEQRSAELDRPAVPFP